MYKKVKHIQNFLRFTKGKFKPIIGPVKAAWEVVYTCNAKCRTCLRWQTKSDPQTLSTQDGKKLIKQLAKIGVLNLTFTGGEPLLRNDIYELIKYAKRKKLSTALMSNGLLINERRASEFGNDRPGFYLYIA